MKTLFRMVSAENLNKAITFVLILIFFVFFKNVAGQNVVKVGWPYKISEVKPLCDYIGEKNNVKVEIISFKNLKEVRGKMLSGEMDICFLNGFQYVLLSGEHEVELEPLAVLGAANGKPSTYKSCIIANSKTALSSVNRIKDKAPNLRVMFVSLTSTSGHLAPRLAFSALGLNQPERNFKSIAFAGSHKNTIIAIKEGKADIGACSKTELEFAIDKGLTTRREVVTVWTSGAIPQGPIVARKDLSEKLKKQVQNTLINLSSENPSLWREINTTWSGAVDATQFVKANDDAYDSIRRTAGNLQDLIRILSLYLK